jgi:hypothetical protein
MFQPQWIWIEAKSNWKPFFYLFLEKIQDFYFLKLTARIWFTAQNKSSSYGAENEPWRKKKKAQAMDTPDKLCQGTRIKLQAHVEKGWVHYFKSI